MKGLNMLLGYCRISHQTQSDGTSLDYQNQKINEYAKLHNLNLTDVYSEIDSGGNNDRAVLKMIENLIVENKVSTLIVFKVDRLSRNILGGLQFIDKCKTHNCRVVSITENIDTDNENSNLILSLMLMIATEEIRMIKSRCNQGRLMKWKQKKLPYSKIPFGYKRNKDGDVVIDETNSHIVKYIFNKWNTLSKNKNLTKMAKTKHLIKLLNRNGFTFNNKRFQGWNIRDILTQTFYCGLIKWKDEIQPSNYDVLISKRMFNLVQSVL